MAKPSSHASLNTDAVPLFSITAPEITPAPEQHHEKHSSTKDSNGTNEQHEQTLKFLIGLRLLGEKKQQRFLTYLRSIQERSHNGHASV